MNWKKHLIGDAFALPSRHPRFYVDLGLIPVVLVSGVWLLGSLWSWPPAKWAWDDILSAAMCLLLALLIAKERLLVAGAALGYVVVQAGSHALLVQAPARRVVFGVISLLAGICFLLVVRKIHNRPSSYAGRGSVVDWVATVAFFAVVLILIVRIIRETLRFYLAG
jgi:hypothetical protein